MQGLFVILLSKVTTLLATMLFQCYLQNLPTTLLTKTKQLITVAMIKPLDLLMKLNNSKNLKIIVDLAKVSYLTISSKMIGAK